MLLWLSLFLLRKIDLASADLGRHLVNGRIFWEQGKILKTNFYSYTTPDFPTINHHWGAGAIFWLVYRIGGFPGLSVFYLGLFALSFLILTGISERENGLPITFLVSFLLIPLIGARYEVRPEVFSYLFAAIFFWVLRRESRGEAGRLLWLLPLIQAVWVNVHVYFFASFILVFACWFESLFALRIKRVLFTRLTILGLALSLASLVNPFGFKAVVYPLQIFKNYNYRIVENQSIRFLESIKFNNPSFLQFKLVAFLGLTTLTLLLAFKKKKFGISNVLLFVFWGIMSFVAIRNFSVFGLLMIPVLGLWCGLLLGHRRKLALLGIVLVFLFELLNYGRTFRRSAQIFGIGLAEGEMRPIDFINNHAIKGPIFNTYDLGSYLIYGLYPRERVYVDNRPEAYPASFFENYRELLAEDKLWVKENLKYRFNAIVLSPRDLLPEARNFLARRLKDPEWKLIYADKFALVFVRI